MAGLKDMEELIHEVREKEIAEYLQEALRCYGAGAYRATIVVTNIALFDGLLRKINALAPVSKVCKEIADELNPLADAQKVFETPLIHKLKAKNIITDFESERLEQLNRHRNKAAHPSGHFPSAEEARFVFSDAITLFLSRPIRQTTYIVDKIAEELKGDNFFPSNTISDIKLVVTQEVTDLDNLARPALLSKLDTLASAAETTTKKNARNFLLGAATLREDHIRKPMVAKVLAPRLSSLENGSFVTSLVSCDPYIVEALTEPEKLKLDSLLLDSAKKIGVDTETTRLSSPTQVASRLLQFPGVKALSSLPLFYEYTVKSAPLTQNFISSLKDHTEFLKTMRARYIEIASSSSFDVANRFARRMGDLDGSFSKTFDDRFCFEIIAGVVHAAEVGAYSATNVSEGGFAENVMMKASALNFSKGSVTRSRKVLKDLGIDQKLSTFRKNYLS